MVIDHITIPVRDYASSKAFYAWALRPLGLVLLLDWPDGRKAWFGVEGEPSSLWLCESEAAGSLEVTLAAEDPHAVEAFHTAALSVGADTEWEPGPRPEFHRGYYAARVLDPDGNAIEAVHHGAVGASTLRQSAAA